MEGLRNKYFDELISKKFFDSFSHSFKSLEIEDKLIYLARYLDKGGDLHFAIATYRAQKSEITLESLDYTLQYYINYLRYGKSITVLTSLLADFLSQTQLITLLSAELKARFYFEYEYKNNPIERFEKPKIRISHDEIENYFGPAELSKEEQLLRIFKADLPDDFDLGR